MTVIIEDILNCRSSEALIGKAILAMVGIVFKVEDEEVKFVEAIVVDLSFNTMKKHRENTKKRRSRERENFLLLKKKNVIEQK